MRERARKRKKRQDKTNFKSLHISTCQYPPHLVPFFPHHKITVFALLYTVGTFSHIFLEALYSTLIFTLYNNDCLVWVKKTHGRIKFVPYCHLASCILYLVSMYIASWTLPPPHHPTNKYYMRRKKTSPLSSTHLQRSI